MKKAASLSYQPFLLEVLGKIRQARYEMLKTVSKQTVLLYWEIGKSVSEKVSSERWGKSVVENFQKIYKQSSLVFVGFLLETFGE
jgi:hypothetical protein